MTIDHEPMSEGDPSVQVQLNDLVKIDGRWGQFVAGGGPEASIKFLDDNQFIQRIQWPNFTRVRDFGRSSVAILAAKKETVVCEEIAQASSRRGKKLAPRVLDSLCVFGEFVSKKAPQ